MLKQTVKSTIPSRNKFAGKAFRIVRQSENETSNLDRSKYGKLLHDVMPQPITSEQEHKAWLNVSSNLMKTETLTPEEETLLALLGALISDYEKKVYTDFKHTKSDPAELLSYLMQENHLTQRDFPEISQSRVSEILAGKRKISRAQARVFAERFKVDPVLFLY